MHPENSPSRIQFYMQKTKSSEYYYYYYIQRAKRPSFQKRNSTHRRQGDLLEIHPCVLQDLPKAFQTFQTFQSFQSFQTFQTFQAFQSFQTFQPFMTFQPFQAILQVPVSPGNPPHSSILRLECIFYTFYKFYSSIGFHKKTPSSTSWTIQTTNITFFKEREMLWYRSNMYRLDVKMTYSPE